MLLMLAVFAIVVHPAPADESHSEGLRVPGPSRAPLPDVWRRYTRVFNMPVPDIFHGNQILPDALTGYQNRIIAINIVRT